jgi:hypothetical protein
MSTVLILISSRTAVAFLSNGFIALPAEHPVLHFTSTETRWCIPKSTARGIMPLNRVAGIVEQVKCSVFIGSGTIYTIYWVNTNDTRSPASSHPTPSNRWLPRIE